MGYLHDIVGKQIKFRNFILPLKRYTLMEATQFNSALDPQQANPSSKQISEPYKFSSDELRVLKQCNIESFYQRCLPFGTLFGLGTYYGVKSGFLRAHARFGATPKVCVAVIAGYFIGKISYQQKCAEKLMALPNSSLGEILRQRKRQGVSENISLDPGFSAPIGIDTSTLSEVQAPQQSYLDMDSDRPFIGDFDKPPQDDSYDVSAIPLPPGGVSPTTYEELRKRNREEYEAQRNKPYRSSGDTEEPLPVIRARIPGPSPSKPKNKYGDEWEQ